MAGLLKCAQSTWDELQKAGSNLPNSKLLQMNNEVQNILASATNQMEAKELIEAVLEKYHLKYALNMKRQKLHSLKKAVETLDVYKNIKANHPDMDPAKALEEAMFGTSILAGGNSKSTLTVRESYKNLFGKTFDGEAEKLGIRDLWESGALNDDFYTELGAVNAKQGPATKNGPARQMAELVTKVQNLIANKFTGKSPLFVLSKDYLMKRMHSASNDTSKR